MSEGGYDIGYQSCDCFWGNKPGSLISKLEMFIPKFNALQILDLGCGEGKNSIFFANKGAFVDAYDISEYAINNALKICNNHPNLTLTQANALNLNLQQNYFDVVISYGLFHCFQNRNEVSSLIDSCIKSIKKNGYFIICAFNSRKQDLSAHVNFAPLLLDHKEYLSYFIDHKILFQSDEDLFETHPHNNIPHMHSMTRLIIRIL